MFELASVLKLISAVGKVTAGLPEFRSIYDQIVATFGSHDQATLRQAYADLMADNDSGHRRLQEKLGAAAAK